MRPAAAPWVSACRRPLRSVMPQALPFADDASKTCRVGVRLGTGAVPALFGVGPLAARTLDREPAEGPGGVLLPDVLDGIGDVAQRFAVDGPQPLEDAGR